MSRGLGCLPAPKYPHLLLCPHLFLFLHLFLYPHLLLCPHLYLYPHLFFCPHLYLFPHLFLFPQQTTKGYNSILDSILPLPPYNHQKIKKSLESHDIKVTSSLGTLQDLLTKTKATPPLYLTPNVIHEISCYYCTATYNGQTNRPLIKRIKEHESHSKLHLHNPQSICSCPPFTDHWTQDSLGQNDNTYNYKIQDTIGPHRTHSH